MVDVSPRKEERKTVEAQESCTPVISSSSTEEEVLNAFLSLKADESKLIEQREHLKVLFSQLETKVKEDVERRKRKVDRLTNEVSDLKRKCEKLVKCINAETAAECTQPAL
jgi:hypothetical protein